MKMNAKGFTLIEVMVATLVFAVGMMAVITMEYSALKAYSASRDTTVAADLASRTASIMRVEASNWAQRPLEDVLTMPPVYGGSDSPIPVNMLRDIHSQNWVWQRATYQPVTERMINNASLGRYCVYFRGAPSDLALGGKEVDVGGMMVTVTPLISAQLAVIYPTSTSSFATQDCATISCQGDGTKNATDLLQNTGLDLMATGDDVLPELERCGWRAVYAGALISR